MSRLLGQEALGYVQPPAGRLRCLRSHSRTPLFSEAMGTFVVEGGQRLEGRIRPAGNKNAGRILTVGVAVVLGAAPAETGPSQQLRRHASC